MEDFTVRAVIRAANCATDAQLLSSTYYDIPTYNSYQFSDEDVQRLSLSSTVIQFSK